MNEQELSTIITMFIRMMQINDIWPCKRQFGKVPMPLEADEVFKLIDEFVSEFEL